MTLSLFRQDPVFRSLIRWGLIVLGTVSVFSLVRLSIAGLLVYHARSGGFGSVAILVGTLWFPVAIYLAYAGVAGRSTRLELGLPISPRLLWARHLLAVVSGALVMLLLGAVVVAVQARGLERWLDRDPLFLGPSVRVLVPGLIAGLFLSSVILQSIQPTVYKIAFDRRYAVLASGTLFGVFVLLVILSYLPAPAVIVPVGAATWVTRRTYRRIPVTFDLVPYRVQEFDPSMSAAPTREDASDTRPGGPVFVQGVVWRAVWHWWWMLYLPGLIGMGMLLAGLPYTWLGDADIRFFNIAIIWYWFFLLLLPVMKKLHSLDPLPIRRRTLFAHLFLPSLICFCLGYGASEIALLVRDRGMERVAFREWESHYYLYVPADRCEIAWGDDPVVNTAPWGESHEAWSKTFYEGSRARIYSPFSTPPGSSIDFVAWQIRRAAKAVYDVSIPEAQIKERYLRSDSEGRVVPKAENLSIRADFVDSPSHGAGGAHPVALAIAVFPAFVLIWVYLGTFRAGARESASKWVAVGVLGVTLALHIGGMACAITGLCNLWVGTAFMDVLIRMAANAFPGVVPALWLICALLIAGGYRLTERRFERVELPPTPHHSVD